MFNLFKKKEQWIDYQTFLALEEKFSILKGLEKPSSILGR